jgi:hypothetical protein
MNNLFLALFLLSLVGLIVGLAKPSIVRVKSRKQVSYIFGGALVLFFILFGVTTPPTVSSGSVPQQVADIDSGGPYLLNVISGDAKSNGNWTVQVQ